MRLLPAALVLLACACSPEPGDPCRGNAARCLGERSALWCLGGVMTEVRCQGQGGCNVRGTRVSCDQSVSELGQPCLGAEGGAACSPDGAELLRCRGSRMVLASRCRGPLGCRRENNLAYCDESIGLADDPCDAVSATCSADGRHVLDCTGGRFVVRHAADRCEIEGDIVRWTGPYATVGEPCSGEGSVACSDDGRMLGCRDGQLAPYLPCRGPRGCYAEGDFNRCDQSIAAAGDACAGSYAACSQDHTAQLRCRDGVFVHEQRCADCSVRGGAVHCRPFIPRPHR